MAEKKLSPESLQILEQMGLTKLPQDDVEKIPLLGVDTIERGIAADEERKQGVSLESLGGQFRRGVGGSLSFLLGGLGSAAEGAAKFVEDRSIDSPLFRLLSPGARTSSPVLRGIGGGLKDASEFIDERLPPREEGFFNRVAENLGGGLPFLTGFGVAAPAILPAGIAVEAASAVTGAAGEEGARKAGLGPVGQTVGGIAGSLLPNLPGGIPKIFGKGKTVAETIDDVSPAIVEQRIKNKLSQQLREAVSDPESTADIIRQGIRESEDSVTGLGRLDSPAEILARLDSEDPGIIRATSELSNIEKTAKLLGSGDLAEGVARKADIAERIAKKDLLRKNILENIAPGSSVDDFHRGATGTKIRNILSDIDKADREKIAKTFSTIDRQKKTRIPISEARKAEVEAFVAERFPEGFKGRNATVKRRVSEFLNQEDPVSISAIQNSRRSEILEEIREIEKLKGGPTKDTAVLGLLAQQYDNIVDDAIEAGKGITKAQAKQWREARKLRFDLESIFPPGSLTKRLISGRNFGVELIKDEDVISKIIQSPTTVRQVLRAAPKKKFPDVHAAIRRGVINTALKGKAAIGGEITVSKFNKFREKNKEIFDLLFSPEEKRRIAEVGDSLFGESKVLKIGKSVTPGETTTASQTSLIKDTGRVIAGIAKGVTPIRSTVLDRALRFILRLKSPKIPPDRRIREVLFDAAVLNPRLMSELLSPTTPQRADRVGVMLMRHFVDANADVLAGLISGTAGVSVQRSNSAPVGGGKQLPAGALGTGIRAFPVVQ